jgi:hypothetical protein
MKKRLDFLFKSIYLEYLLTEVLRMNNQGHLEYKLNNGVMVLAKEDQFGINPYSYCNRTQAQKRADKVNGEVRQFGGCPVFYVTLKK